MSASADAFISGIIIGTATTVIGGLILFFIKRKIEQQAEITFDILRKWDYGKTMIELRNTSQRSMHSCLVYCDDQLCKWWDEHAGKRTIASGGGANALLPADRQDLDPMVVIKIRGKVRFKKRLSEIDRA